MKLVGKILIGIVAVVIIILGIMQILRGMEMIG